VQGSAVAPVGASGGMLRLTTSRPTLVRRLGWSLGVAQCYVIDGREHRHLRATPIIAASITKTVAHRRDRSMYLFPVKLAVRAISWVAILLCLCLAIPVALTWRDTVHSLYGSQVIATAGLLIAVIVVASAVLLFSYRHHLPRRREPASESARTPLSDEPQVLSEEDSYGRLPFANELAEVFGGIELNHPSSVVALTGPWGSGKTSVLETVVNRLKSSGNPSEIWRVAALNPWRYESTADLTAGFFSELREALPPSDQWSEARDKLAALFRTVAPLGSVTSIWGLDSSKVVDAIWKRVEGRGAASRAQAAAEVAMRAASQRVLFVIDDVDRLAPDELLSLFKLVRLIGRFHNVHYLLVYDEKTVTDVLTRTGLVGTRKRARDYLEKIVQVRVDLPSVRPAQAEKAVDEAIDKLTDKFDIRIESWRRTDFALLYHRHIAQTLRTPRFINQWFNHIELLFPPLAGEVDFIDFLILTWLRLLHPGIPSMLQQSRAELFPSDGPLGIFGVDSDNSQEETEWLARIKAAGVPRGEESRVLAVLAALFPTIDRARTSGHSYRGTSDVGARLGVGHPNYFARYFDFGVPEEELRESDFRELMSALAAGEGVDDDIAALTHHLISDPRNTADRIEQWYAGNSGNLYPVLRWLALNFADVSDRGLISGQSTIRGLMYRLAKADSSVVVDGVLTRLLHDRRTLYPTGLLIHDLIREDLPLVSPVELDRLKGETVRAIERDLSNRVELPRDPSDEFWRLLWLWSWLDPYEARRWYRSQVTDGLWDLLDALAGVVASATSVGSDNPTTKLRGLPDANIETFFGIEWLTKYAIMNNFQVSEEKSRYDYFDGPIDSWDARIATARAALGSLIRKSNELP